MAYLQHLKWPMAVRRTFILRLYGVSGVLIEYSVHNCRYFYFIPSETLILGIFGNFFTLWTLNTRNGLSPTPQMAYGSHNTIYTESIWSFRCSNWIFCSQFQIFWLYTLLNSNFCYFGTFFHHFDQKYKKWPISNSSNGIWQLLDHLYWDYMELQVF